MILPKSLQNLIDELGRLPGIGPKTASRLAFYLISKSEPDLKRLGLAINQLKRSLVECQLCYSVTDSPLCKICSDKSRHNSQIMVVAKPLDVIAMEKTDFQGLYLVIGGLISPIDGIGPDELRINQLLDRLSSTEIIKEVILATDPSLEGEATALFITRAIDRLKSNRGIGPDVVVTRLARGLPIGSELEYADELTLKRALEGRKEY